MSRLPTKAAQNIWCIARLEAAKCNEKLSSREGAAEELGIDRTRLARIELGSVRPYPEEALLMADLYNAPELRNLFCKKECPLGCDLPDWKLEDLDRITVKAIVSFRKITETKESLLDIVEDGIITDDEKPKLDVILKNLDELATVSQNLKIWIAKNLEKGAEHV